jgi:phytoene dehydrogenase-like protein
MVHGRADKPRSPAFGLALHSPGLAHQGRALRNVSPNHGRLMYARGLQMNAWPSTAAPTSTVPDISERETYDVVVIGSGLGGLATAALLSAAYSKSVCVCESHSVIGGAAHSFTRRSKAGVFTFDSGPHLFSGLATDIDSEGVDRARLSSNPMQHVLRAVNAHLPVHAYDEWGCIFPEGFFATRVSPSVPLFSELVQAASGPAAAVQVAQLLKAMEPLFTAATALPPAALRAGDPLGSLRVAARFLARPAILASLPVMPQLLSPFRPLLHKHVTDPFARNFIDLLCFLLAGVTADMIPTAEVAFMFSEWTGRTAGSGDSDSVLEHPIGGADAIARALAEAVQRRSTSKIRVNAHVEEILIEEARNSGAAEKSEDLPARAQMQRRAVGVQLTSGHRIYAREAVVSNASAWDTPRLVKSLRDDVRNNNQMFQGAQKHTAQLQMCPSFMHLHLAIEVTDSLLKSLPQELKLNYAYVRDWSLGLKHPDNVVLISVPSIADPSLAPSDHIVIHAYSPATEPYEPWRGLVCGTPEYDAMKERRSENLWRAIERVIPGARRHAVVEMVGTPLTHERFLRRARGTYGPEIDARKFGETFPFQRRSEIADGLWCVGDSTFPGIGVPAVAASAWLAANGMVDISDHEKILRKVGL